MTLELRKIGSLPRDIQRAFGQVVNDTKKGITEAITERRAELASGESAKRLAKEAVDVSLPGRFYQTGRPHILVETLTRIKQIFIGLGYEFVETPEIEHQIQF